MNRKIIPAIAAGSLFLGGCSSGIAPFVSSSASQSETAADADFESASLWDTIFALVSSAENSTTDWQKEYGYIEDIDDGRGYTAGLIGFTSATGDLLDVVRLYVEKKPTDNPLKPYLSALEKDKGSDSHAGLDGFEKAWKKTANDSAMIEAQNEIIDQQYKDPAIGAARQDGLCNLGLYIYYDALVVHGPGDDPDSFDGIRQAAMKQARTPAEGGSMTTYLNAFLDARTDIMEQEEAHRDLSRIETQRQFLKEGNFALKRPLSWTMYGDHFELK